MTNSPIGWSERYRGFWVVVGYEECRKILMDPQRFSSTGCLFPNYGTPDGSPMMLAEYDPPQHEKYRRLVQSSFTARSAEELVENLRRDTNMLIDGFIEEGETDLCRSLTDEIPSRFTAQFLGLDPADGELYRVWTHAIAHAHEKAGGRGRAGRRAGDLLLPTARPASRGSA